MIFTLLISTAFAIQPRRTGTSYANDPEVTCPSTGFIGSYDWFVCSYGYPGEALQNNINNHCDMRENEDSSLPLIDFPVNHRCFNWGTCIEIFAGQDGTGYYGGQCSCADKSIDGNWAITNVPSWETGKYSGNVCEREHSEISARVSYIIYFNYNNAPSGQFGIQGKLVCNTGTSGAGVNYGETGWQTIPDLTALVKGTINYPEQVDLAADGYINYKGLVVATYKDSGQLEHCKICTDADPCKKNANSVQHANWPNLQAQDRSEWYGSDPGDSGTGGYVMITFGSDFNTYYNLACNDNNEVPTDSGGDACLANGDRGLEASIYWSGATQGNDGGTHHQNHYNHLANEPTSTPITPPTITDPDVAGFGLAWNNEVILKAVFHTQAQESNAQTDPLPDPTRSPTIKPTVMPTKSPTMGVEDCFADGYTHQVADMKFIGISQDLERGCRWGLLPEWPGGNSNLMCDSPYVICLPQENTPSGFPLPNNQKDPYFSDTHAYSIEECKKECAYDQRCTGFEFRATSGKLGDCLLIDDVPVEATGPGGSSARPGITTEAGLDAQPNFNFPGAICYQKGGVTEDYCNPYFAASQLNQVMLNCYCPNNRKGFYTKNVVRTVGATKFCGNDPTGKITERIEEAQANRMFHLCENWCLFNTQNPRQESWYHDPWEECWREQYAGIGKHRSYCYRVIRDPYTIEQVFIDKRAAKMCPSSTPTYGGNPNTPAPTNMAEPPTYEWVLANEQESCDAACARVKGDTYYCSENSKYVVEGLSTLILQAAYGDPFGSVGIDCSDTYVTGEEGWAHPSVGPNGVCILRNPLTNSQDWMQPTGCNVAIGVGYRRLCSCSNFIIPINVNGR